MRKTNGLAKNPTADVPIIDAYELVLSPHKQQRFSQLSYVYVLCPYCDAWRIHGRALHETRGLIHRASHCVDCPTEDTGYVLRIIGPWSDLVRSRCQGRYKPPAPKHAAKSGA
jgi:hypothetical protein